MTAATAVRDTAGELAEVGVETPDVDAQWLVAHVARTSRSELRADSRRELSEVEVAQLRALVGRRLRREPLAYVLGAWGFRRLTLKVDRRALVPRPETELLVERALARLRGLEAPRVLDVGVGSGAIAIAIADEHAGATVVALDSSAAAVELARENAEAAGVATRVAVSVRDVVQGLSPDAFDLVVANPPYVPEAELEELEPEVRDWEPREALVDRGQTTLIARAARDVLKPGGWLALETRPDAARNLRAELDSLGYVETLVTRDLAGRERIVEARWPG